MVAQEDRTRRRLSVDEWRELVRTSGARYEYHDGWVYAMAGASLAQGRIAFNAQQYGPDDQLEIESIDVRIAVDALYRLTDVPLVRARQAAQDGGQR
jgi:S-adenosylmethionine hydrolase